MARTIYETFNARTLTAKQLADGFIINTAFQELAGQNHSIIIGPRGSGKTTLMRMLQVETLASWNAPFAAEIQSRVDFTGVFIPTDMVWYKQSQELRSCGANVELVNKFINEIFIYHVIDCLLQSLQYRMTNDNESCQGYKKICISISDEMDMVTNLSLMWKLSCKAKTVRSLRNAMIVAVGKITNLEVIKPQNIDIIITERLSGFGDINSVLSNSVKLINSCIGEDGGKWCFLFDELELASDGITQSLLDSIRGADPAIIYKLSLAPFNENVKKTYIMRGPMVGQDYTTIRLPNPDIEFTQQLCQQIVNNNGRKEDLNVIFEKVKDLDYTKLCNDLAKKDDSFTDYLFRKKISLSEIPRYTEADRMSEIRKLRWVLYLRNEYLTMSNRIKSRHRAPDIYGGIDEIISELEFNPRMIIGTLNKMFNRAQKKKITMAYQIAALNETCCSFSALLNTMPVKVSGCNTVSGFVGFIADNIVRKFILGPQFYDEPRNTFYFLKEPDSELTEAMGEALNTGAIVCIDENSNEINISSLLNKSFRLSYLFSHALKLPVSKIGSIEYGKLISTEKPIVVEKLKTDESDQLELYL